MRTAFQSLVWNLFLLMVESMSFFAMYDVTPLRCSVLIVEENWHKRTRASSKSMRWLINTLCHTLSRLRRSRNITFFETQANWTREDGCDTLVTTLQAVACGVTSWRLTSLLPSTVLGQCHLQICAIEHHANAVIVVGERLCQCCPHHLARCL